MLMKRSSAVTPAARLVLGLVVVLVACLIVVPLALMVLVGITNTEPGSGIGSFTLANFSIFLDASTYKLLWTTAIFALGSMAIAMPLGATLAWLVERTDVGLRTAAYLLIPVITAIPGVLYAIAWVLTLVPRVGAANVAWMGVFGGTKGPFDPYNLGSMI